ncbi:MAG: Lrp/AsnC family transcriptional regulator [Candidatus Binatia bacterium]
MKRRRAPKTRRPRAPARSPRVDELDRKLMRLLAEDGRMTNRDLARSLGSTEPTVRARIRRLGGEGIMRVVAVTDMEAAGYDFYVLLWIQVEGRPVREVAQELAGLPSLFTVVLMSGVYDIMAGLVATDKRELRKILTHDLARVQGIRTIESTLALDVLKLRAEIGVFAP